MSYLRRIDDSNLVPNQKTLQFLLHYVSVYTLYAISIIIYNSVYICNQQNVYSSVYMYILYGQCTIEDQCAIFSHQLFL